MALFKPLALVCPSARTPFPAIIRNTQRESRRKKKAKLKSTNNEISGKRTSASGGQKWNQHIHFNLAQKPYHCIPFKTIYSSFKYALFMSISPALVYTIRCGNPLTTPHWNALCRPYTLPLSLSHARRNIISKARLVRTKMQKWKRTTKKKRENANERTEQRHRIHTHTCTHTLARKNHNKRKV